MSWARTCKLCRRLGESVCGREKCAWKRKPYPPGVHGKAFRRGLSEYGLQLKEKQKVKFLYGLRERQFKNYVLDAISQNKMPTSDAFVTALETRLDNAVFRSGFAPTRSAARQMVSHGHVSVNNRRAAVPSFRLKVGDEIKLRPGSAQSGFGGGLSISLKKHNPPEWILLDKGNFSAKIVSNPAVDSIEKTYKINSIVEYYLR